MSAIMIMGSLLTKVNDFFLLKDRPTREKLFVF